MVKATKRDKFEGIVGILEGAGETDLMDFVIGEIALIDKRAEAPRKPTQADVDKAVLKGEILEFIAGADGVQAGTIAKAKDVSVQKVTALVTQLVKAGEVIREDGKVTLFRVA